MIYIDSETMVLGFALGLFLGTLASLIYHTLAAFWNWIRNS